MFKNRRKPQWVCSDCKSDNLIPYGYSPDGKRKLMCADCGHKGTMLDDVERE